MSCVSDCRVDRVTIKDQDEVEKQTVELEKDKKKAAELRKKESHRVSGANFENLYKTNTWYI